MPRYFFDLHRVDSELFDDEGTEFGKPDDAVMEAEGAILEFFVESFKMSKEFDLVGIRICDAAGVLVREVSSRDILANLISPEVISI